MKKKLLLIVAVISMMGTTLQSRASIVGVTSPLAGVDSVNWGQLGPAFTVLSSPQSFVTNGGVSGQVSSAGGDLERLDQGNGWNGNFLLGTPLLWDEDKGPDITLNFDAPILGFGSNIQADFFGPFVARLMDNLGDLFTESGTSNGNNDGSAIFIGLLSDAATITSITFSLDSASSHSNNFAIGTSAAAVPVPAAGPLLAGAVGSLAVFGRWRKKRTIAAA
jgi:hypothetical protein